MAEETKALSKKEQNKLLRKEKKVSDIAEIVTSESDNKNVYWITFNKGCSPEVTRVLELLAGSQCTIKYTINKAPPSGELSTHLPLMTDGSNKEEGRSIAGDCNIAKFLIRSGYINGGSAFYGDDNAWNTSQIDTWCSVYDMSTVSNSFTMDIFELMESHLSMQTFMVGDSLSLADIAMYFLVKKVGVDSINSPIINVKRWFTFIKSLMPDISNIPISYIPTSKPAPINKSSTVKETDTKTTSSNAGNSAVEDGGTCPPLEGAIEGQVCTRFPPEPSGYLHIGHTKAVLLNQYYAQRYKGRLLIRFDDTNPSKEKEEFEENILHDLDTLGVKADAVSHSSDHFATCEELARKMILSGLAYMDDTDQETMQAERLEKKESKHRNTSPEWSLEWFEKLLKGDEAAQSYCLRAKIDMSSVNGTMRDPVLYRYNGTPHHRTGTKFKGYPTYDFACPLIDSIEGVTHALRTTEYNDRDEQYHWIQNALNLRKVVIQAFGKMNFIHTVLSKRKLTWFVENNLVEGWFDPRFPTVQGCVRRGMNVMALKNFIISQGASRRIITMEWDKFWSENKKILEDTSPRYMGVTMEDMVEIWIDNVPDEIMACSVPIHPSKPEMGMRVMRKYCKVLIDQIDAVLYSIDEEVTLVRWGNMKINEIIYDPIKTSKVIAIKATYDPSATNFSKTKKASWVASIPDVVPCKLVEYDHLIYKAKLGENDKFQDYVNPVTKLEIDALCDPCLRLVKAGDVIQLERKGFFRCDKVHGGSDDKPAILIAIPDGKPRPPLPGNPPRIVENESAADTTTSNKKKSKGK